jgi:hypothetical protein
MEEKMSPITNAQRDQINKSRRAFQKASVGTIIQNLQTYLGASGSVTLTAVHTNASVVTIETGLGTCTGFLVQAFSSGSIKGDPYVHNLSGSLLIKARSAVYGVSGSFVLTAGDIVNWIAW